MRSRDLQRDAQVAVHKAVAAGQIPHILGLACDRCERQASDRIGKHGVRTGPAARRCATIEEMRAGGLLPTPAGWSMAADAERARRFRERVEKASRSGGIGPNRPGKPQKAVGAVAAEAERITAEVTKSREAFGMDARP